jgi:hypothetical protein
MKKLSMIITIVSVFGACKNGSSDLQTNKVTLTDTTGNYSKSISSDTAVEMQKVAKPANHESNESRNKTTNSSVTSRDNSTSSTNNENTTTSATTKKKGWSSRAKGAVIGGATGAVGGAIISKKKGKGAIIGGLAGAAGGYIIGNEKDKKKNR